MVLTPSEQHLGAFDTRSGDPCAGHVVAQHIIEASRAGKACHVPAASDVLKPRLAAVDPLECRMTVDIM